MSDVVGYRYLFGIHMGISRGPVDELVEIKVGDRVAWRGSVKVNSEITIDKPDLFGGEESEGGVQGPLTLMMGGPTQTAPAALNTVLRAPRPGFRRMFTAFFDGMVTAMNPYPKPWKFRVRRALEGWDGSPWYPEKAVISLVRPVSAAEVGLGIEVANVSGSESDLQAVLTGPDWKITLGVTGAVTSIISVTLVFTTYGIETGLVSTLTLNVPSFTLGPGNTVNILPSFGFDPAQVGTLYTESSYIVDYRYDLTTVDPTVDTLGDTLIQAMNPIHILYETFTNREWGRGLPSASLDDASWRLAADTAFAERFGLCLRWNRRDSIQSFLQGVLDHVGAVIYPDRTTSKIKIKLIRDDYLPGNVTLFKTGTGLLKVSDATISASASMINEVRVTYRDPVTNGDRTVRASNIAGVQASGGTINTVSREFPGLPTADLASRVAKRELKAMSPSIRRFNIELDRRGNDVVPGGLIRIVDPTRNIPDTILRVGTVDYGKMGDGVISIVALQDVFGLPKKSLVTIGPPQSGGGGGGSAARPCIGVHRVFELPYRNLYRALNPADFAFIQNSGAYLATVADEGQPLNTSYQTAVKSGSPDIGTETPPDGSYTCPI